MNDLRTPSRVGYPPYRAGDDADHGHAGDYDDDYYDDDDGDDFYDGDGDYYYDDYEQPVDHRWRAVALTAGSVLVAAVIGTVVILNGGDSGQVAGTVGPTPSRTAVASPSPSASASLAPETVTTLPRGTTRSTPTTSTTRTSAAPSATATPEAAPTVTLNPRTVIYRVTGTKSLLDLVTIVYTDAQGHPQTDLNAALPWSRTIVLNPGVDLKSVVATSVHSQLNCTITDATGQLIAVAGDNSMIATCTR